MSVRRLVPVALLLCALSDSAFAGRRHFTWSYDTEVLPERSVELEQWVTDRQKPPNSWSSVWWAPVIGITDQIELALPVEWFWWQQPAGEFYLETAGVDLRWRLVTADPVEAPKLVPLIRAGVKRLFRNRDAVDLELDAVLSYDAGPVHIVGDVGVIALVDDDPTVTLTYSGGISYALPWVDLHLGAEFLGHVNLEEPVETDPWTMVGPAMAWTHGRFWLTAGILVGLNEAAPKLMPRLIWAVQF